MNKVVKLGALQISDGKHLIALGIEHPITVWAKNEKELMKEFRGAVGAIIAHAIQSGEEPFTESEGTRLREEDLKEFEESTDREIIKFPMRVTKPVRSEEYDFELDWRRT